MPGAQLWFIMGCQWQRDKRAACCLLPYGGFVRVVFDCFQDEGGGGGVDLLQQDFVQVLQFRQICINNNNNNKKIDRCCDPDAGFLD